MMGFAYLNAEVLSTGHEMSERPEDQHIPFAFLDASAAAAIRRAALQPFDEMPPDSQDSHADASAKMAACKETTSVVDGKSILMALRRCCVETSRLVVDSGMVAASGAEGKLRQSQQELRELSVQLLAIQENERRRIAADLHDGIGQSMSLIKMSMESVADLINSGAHQQAVQSLQTMIQKVKDTIAELRCITTDLRPTMLDDLGLAPTLSWFFREFEAAWRDIKIEKDVNITESAIPVLLKTTIFRILQEAMNNIVKHAKAKRVRVCLRQTDGMLEFSVEDDGLGFDQSGALIRSQPGWGMGLLTMKERARSSDGIFDIISIPGKGTRIQVLWMRSAAACERRADVFYIPRSCQQAIAL